MKRKKGKPVNFDVIMKFFMQHYDIPTGADIEKVLAKLDRLEQLIRASRAGSPRKRGTVSGKPRGQRAQARSIVTAADQVLAVIRRHRKGAGLAEIKAGTGFDEKKIRNHVYRLHKMKKIKRKARGIYVAT